jgi:alkylhydroperoxidase family enzyme
VFYYTDADLSHPRTPWHESLSSEQGHFAHFSDKEKEKAALTYAEKLSRSPHDVSDADLNELKKHFSDPEIVDIHLLTGVANLTNRFTDPLGLEVEFPEEKI